MSATAGAESHRRRQKKRPLVWIRRILLGLSVSLVAIASAGLIYQAVAQQIDERNFDVRDSTADWNAYLAPERPKGTPNVLVGVVRRHGAGGLVALWGPDPDADAAYGIARSG